MRLQEFLALVKSGARLSFQESIAVIAEHYHYSPIQFTNGGVVNEARTNEGSCKLFYFAKLHGLTPGQTLGLFGDYYWKDVLENPNASDHANIRAFMRQGWAGIAFDGEALRDKA